MIKDIGKLAGVLLMGLALPACADDLEDETEAAQEDWADARPSRYEIVVEQHCYCDLFTTRTTVDGAAVSAVRVDTGESTKPLHVEALFDEMLRYLDDDYADAKAEFDSTWHYPTSFYVDPDAHMADEEWGFTVSCFATGDDHCE